MECLRSKNILLTGGAGDLGQYLAPRLLAHGAQVKSLDPVPSPVEGLESVSGSVMDRAAVRREIEGCDLVIHIAAWHGFHEFTRSRSDYDFWDLNMTGTFNVLESCVENRCDKIVFVSSTSVDEWPGIYGMTKALGEELCRAFASRHGMKIIAVRPRAFIPPTNTAVYSTFREWAEWFSRGAVHISDVAEAMFLAAGLLFRQASPFFDSVEIDARHDFSEAECRQWVEQGWDSIVASRFGQHARDLDELDFRCESPPSRKDLGKARDLLNYKPTYGFTEMIEELIARSREQNSTEAKRQ